MNKLYEVLEICLQEIEQGADIDTVLFRYPDLADELRPILEASVSARNRRVPAPSADVVRLNRARVLQHAARLRASKVRASQRIWIAALRRVVVTLAVVTALFVSGTGLVRAASTTIPGDNLYPVKRTWEDVLLLFTFNLQQRDALEVEHENERLQELHELFAEGRDADVDFAGLIMSQNGNKWIVSGIPVTISAQTEIRDQDIVTGSAVRVEGHTQSDGAVLADEIKLLPPDAKLPDGSDKHDDSDKELEEGSPKIEETEEPNSESRNESSIDKSGEKTDASSEESHNKDGNRDSSDDGGSHEGGDDSGGDSSSSEGGGD